MPTVNDPAAGSTASAAASTAAPPAAALAGGLQTFSDEADRRRLSGVALKAFRNLVAGWKLGNAEAAALLGVSVSTWDRLKRDRLKRARSKPDPSGGGATLSQDQLTRISALVGIYKGLHLLFADEMADRWPLLENASPLLNHRTPVAAMIDGGIPCMLDVRRYVDAVRGGL